MRYAAHSPLPRVRHVEVLPVEHNGTRAFYIRDPLEFAPQPLVLGTAGLLILSYLDGEHSIDQVRRALRERLAGADIGEAEIRGLIDTLREGCYLDDRVTAERIARVCEEFDRAEVRPAWHAGTVYPRDPRQLAAMLDRFFAAAATTGAAASVAQGSGERSTTAADARAPHAVEAGHLAAGHTAAVEPADPPGACPTAPPAHPDQLAAIMCPHIDLRVGGEIYPPAFAALAEAARAPRPIELYVILGVAHNGGVEPGVSFAIAADKHYATPFGRAPTCRRVIAEWSRRAGRDVTERQWLHRTEHSVEFPLLFLQYTHAQGELPPFEVVPVLLGSVDGYLHEGADPLQAPEVAGELQALHAAVAACGKRALYVLSVDLAHIGPKFGDAERVDDAAAAACERADRNLLSYAQRFDAAGFTRALHADRNSRNVDAIAGLFSLYPLLTGTERRGTLLSYGQNRQRDTGSLVSYASMAFYHTPAAQPVHG